MGRKVNDHSSWIQDIQSKKWTPHGLKVPSRYKNLFNKKSYACICTIDVHVVQNQKKIMHDIISFFLLVNLSPYL